MGGGEAKSSPRSPLPMPLTFMYIQGHRQGGGLRNLHEPSFQVNDPKVLYMCLFPLNSLKLIIPLLQIY